MYKRMCLNCGSEFIVPIKGTVPTSIMCPMCTNAGVDIKPPAKKCPTGLPDDVKLLAREIYTRAIISELHRCHAGDNLLNLVSHASIQAAKSYFEVENNV